VSNLLMNGPAGGAGFGFHLQCTSSMSNSAALSIAGRTQLAGNAGH
jgi:hypothetical protein